MIANPHPISSKQRQRLETTLTLMLQGVDREGREEVYESYRVHARIKRMEKRAAKAQARKEAMQ